MRPLLVPTAIVAAFLVALSDVSHASPPDGSFRDLRARGEVSVSIPEDFKEAAKQESSYPLVLENAKHSIEIRSFFLPWSEVKGLGVRLKSAELVRTIADGEYRGPKVLSSDAMLQRLNADFACMYSIPKLKNPVGPKDTAMVLFASRKDVGLLGTYILFQDQGQYDAAPDSIFYATRFGKPVPPKPSSVFTKWSDDEGLRIGRRYLESQGYNPTDFKLEVLSKEKAPIAYSAYSKVIETFKDRNYFWIGITSDMENRPVIHIFIDKDTGEVIGHITT